MLNIPEEVKALYRKNNIFEETIKTAKLRFYNKPICLLYPDEALFPSEDLFPSDDDPILVIEKDQISSESFTLNQMLCSSTSLKFGECNAAKLEIIVSDIALDVTGKEFVLSIEVGGYEMIFGIYKVDSFVRQADASKRKILAYDRMRRFQSDVAAWYQELTFPMTLRRFRYSLCEYIGIQQQETTLPLDDMQITKTIDPSQLYGLDVIRSICELNGCFGQIDVSGRFKYVSLGDAGLFPSEELHPVDDLFPSQLDGEMLSHYNPSGTTYEDFLVYGIDKVQIRQEEGDVGASFGKGTNLYTIQGNFLVYGKSAQDLLSVALIVHGKIARKIYRPCKIVTSGFPWIEPGDGIVCYTSDDVIETYCLSRSLKGIQGMMDTYEAKGSQERRQDFGIPTQIIQLEGKTAIIKKSVEEVSVKVTDLKEFTEAQLKIVSDEILAEVKRAQEAEAALSIKAEQISLSVKNLKDFTEAQFTLAAEQISLKVSKGNVSSELSVESGKVTISGNRLIVNSTNFKLDEKGNADFSGSIKGATITGSSFESSDGKFWTTNDETYFGGFYAYESDVSGVNYLATHFQEVGMGDYGPFCFWCGDSSNDPPFHVGMDGKITSNDIYLRDTGWGKVWTVSVCLIDLYEIVNDLQDQINNIG